MGGVAGASSTSRRGEATRKSRECFGEESKTLSEASVAKALRAVSGEQRGIGLATDQRMKTGPAPRGGRRRAGVWGLLRSVGLTPSSAEQAPHPPKGTFLFGERRGHFYRWTTCAVSERCRHRHQPFSSWACLQRVELRFKVFQLRIGAACALMFQDLFALFGSGKPASLGVRVV